jgi:hypothetical protein
MQRAHARRHPGVRAGCDVTGDEERRMDRGRILWGLVLLALGGILLADQLGAIAAGATIATWWPAVIVVAGLLRLLDRPPDVSGAGLLVLIGAVLLVWRLGWFDLAVVLPVALIVGGLWVLVRRPRSSAAAVAGDRPLDLVAVFGARDVRVTGDRFTGGKATAVFGGVELDLRGALLGADGARLELVAVLGGVDVVLPRGWDVRISGPAVLGGTDDRTLPAAEGAPRLDVRASAVLGGVTVKTDPEVTARLPARG